MDGATLERAAAVTERLPEVGLHIVARPRGWDGGGLSGLIDLVQRAGELGFSRVGTGDVQGRHYELFCVLAALGPTTRGIALGAQVAQPTSRHPGVMAAGIRSLADICGERLFWVTGRGDGAARNAGRGPLRVADFVRYMKAVRRLIDTGSTTYEGHTYSCAWPTTGGRPALYIAAEGPRMLGVARDFGEGVYVGTGFTPEASNLTRSVLSAGLGPDATVEDEVWWVARSAVTENQETARTSVAEDLSSAGNHALRGDYAAKAVPSRLHAALAEYHRRYSYAAKAAVDGLSPNAQLMRSLGLEEYFRERFGVVGTPVEARRRLAELYHRGVRKIIMRVRDPHELELLAGAIGKTS